MMKKNIFTILKLAALIAVLFAVGATIDVKNRAFDRPEKPVMKPVKIATKINISTKSTKGISSLDEALKAGVPVIVKLGSDRCYACKLMEPVMKELAVEQDGKAVFLSLDVYENRELAGQAGVRVIPTILFYDKRGAPKAKAEGGMSKEELLDAIEELELNK